MKIKKGMLFRQICFNDCLDLYGNQICKNSLCGSKIEHHAVRFLGFKQNDSSMALVQHISSGKKFYTKYNDLEHSEYTMFKYKAMIPSGVEVKIRQKYPMAKNGLYKLWDFSYAHYINGDKYDDVSLWDDYGGVSPQVIIIEDIYQDIDIIKFGEYLKETYYVSKNDLYNETDRAISYGFIKCIDRYGRVMHVLKCAVKPWSYHDYDDLQIRSKSDRFTDLW